MKIRHFFLLLAGICLITACKPVAQKEKVKPQQFELAASPESVGFSAERLARIDSLLQGYVDKGLIPQGVTFIARHGKIVHNKAFGWKDMENKIPASTDDIFRNASQSKGITSVTLMTLYEEGKFLLDDPLAMYLPAFKNMQVIESLDEKTGVVKTRPAKGEITIRQLLSHTSGIHYGNKLYDMAGIPTLHSKDKITIAEVVDKIAAQPLAHDPGAAFTYGMNTDVVGRLIEVLSGKPLDVAMKERVLDPLGIKDTRFYIPESEASRLVKVYGKPAMDSSLRLLDNDLFQTYALSGAKTYFSGGAGLTGTIEDYAKFCQMLLNRGEFNGHRILSRKTIDIMTMNQIGDFEVWSSHEKFGLGFSIFTQEANRHILGSVGSFKWGGMYATEYCIDPKEDLIFLYYTNIFPNNGPNTYGKFRVLLYQALND
jgi:CubicO group peptidase (beta-lactamase class C family)